MRALPAEILLAAALALGAPAGCASAPGTGAGSAPETAVGGIPFETGLVDFAPGDSIEIVEVLGPAPAFRPGEICTLRGRYTLATRDAAEMSACCMDGDSDGDGSRMIRRGSGSFEIRFRRLTAGYPHISLFPPEGGEGFGMLCFGSGDCVWRTPFSNPAAANAVANAATPPAPAGPDDGVLHGVLVRRRTETGLRGFVRVTARDGRAWSATTDWNGDFRLGGLPRGEPLALLAHAPGVAAYRDHGIVIPVRGDGELGWLLVEEPPAR